MAFTSVSAAQKLQRTRMLAEWQYDAASTRQQTAYYHGWPSGYLSLGTVTNDPTPGDLIYYADGGMGMAHIAVYIGNGQAVHGGYNGNQTVVSTVNVGSGPVYIRLN